MKSFIHWLVLGLIWSESVTEFLVFRNKKYFFNSCSCGIRGEAQKNSYDPDAIRKLLTTQFMLGRRKREIEIENGNFTFDSLDRTKRSYRDSYDSSSSESSSDSSFFPSDENHETFLRKHDKTNIYRTHHFSPAVSAYEDDSFGGHDYAISEGDEFDTSQEKYSEKTKARVFNEDKKSRKTVSNMKIVGGTAAPKGEAPWQVLIENMNNAEICGGAIINKMFVLTAAHCTELFKQNGQGRFNYPANILIILQQPDVCNKNTISADKTRRVAKVIDHPKYSKAGSLGELVFDFSLLMMNAPINEFTSEIRPICLPPMKSWTETFTNKFVKIYGYGRTESIPIPGKDQTSCTLLQGTVKIVEPSSDVCLKLSHYPDVQICAWSRDTDACQGDSGGPITWTPSERDPTYLLGVVSYGSDICRHHAAAGVYARVTRVMRWIVANIQSGECGNISN